MSLPLASTVRICEVGLRDGFWTEKIFIPADMKVSFIDRHARIGLPRIEVTSFAHP